MFGFGIVIIVYEDVEVFFGGDEVEVGRECQKWDI